MIGGFLIDGSGYSINIFSVGVGRLGSHAARGGRGGRSSARTMRAVAVAGSHDARVAGGAAGASQQLLYKRRTPNNIYLNCSRAKRRRRFNN